MARRAWYPRSLAALALAAPVVLALGGQASADHRYRYDGWHSRGWYGGGHYWGGHRHHGSSIGGVFVFDLTPPPRRVIVTPPPVVVQPPPVVMEAPSRAYCREYTTTVNVNGRPVETFGTACMQPDGSWRIVSMN